MKKNKKQILANLQNKFKATAWESTFDFESYEIDDETKKFIVIREELIANNFKKYANSKYEICKAIYEIKTKLNRNEQSFVAWYTHNGLTKDKVSEFMKTFELYIQAPHLKDFISSLSGIAVRMLTHKSVPLEITLDALEKGLKNMNDIREFIASSIPKNEVVLFENKRSITLLNSFKKRIEKATTLKDLNDTKKEIETLKKTLLQLESELKEKIYQNENNLKLIG